MIVDYVRDVVRISMSHFVDLEMVIKEQRLLTRDKTIGCKIDLVF